MAKTNSAKAREQQENARSNALYDTINELVALFVGWMGEVDNPGLTPAPKWIFTRYLTPSGIPIESVPTEIELTEDVAWWGGSFGHSCITSDGSWEYIGFCVSYNPDDPGPDDERAAVWVVSSARRRSSLKKGELYPHIPWKVWEPSSANLQDALKTITAIMMQVLSKHYPAAGQRLNERLATHPRMPEGSS